MNQDLAETLLTLHADAFGWALHCCGGDRSRAEEALQVAYHRVAAQRAVPGGGSALRTWWFGVIRLTSHEEARRARYRTSLLGRIRGFFGHSGEEQADPRPGPARRLELSEEAAELRAALAQLPARQAEVLHLVFYQDLSLTEAAAVMGVGVGSARQHYDRGKTRLRELLTPAASAIAPVAVAATPGAG